MYLANECFFWTFMVLTMNICVLCFAPLDYCSPQSASWCFETIFRDNTSPSQLSILPSHFIKVQKKKKKDFFINDSHIHLVNTQLNTE